MAKPNKWAPLSYPSSSIFESAASSNGAATAATAPSAVGGARNENNVLQNKSKRGPNPYFPLHRYVLVAALRELLLIDGQIDVRTLRLIDVNNNGNGNGGADGDVREACCAQDACCKSSIDIVPPDGRNCRFTCAEELVNFMIDQALDGGGDPTQERIEIIVGRDKEISVCESTYCTSNNHVERDNMAIIVSSKRKVSDVDEHCRKKPRLDCSSFPIHLVQLVRSNAVVLQSRSATSSSRDAANHVSPMQSSFQSTVSFPSDADIQEFLLFPQLQRQQQQQHHNYYQNVKKPIMALPPLLQTSITNESHLRSIAHDLSSFIINKYELHTPLSIFLGYKSSSKSKSIDKSKLVSIFADVLFDVSHALYAWIQTELELQRATTESDTKMKGNRVCIPTQNNNTDTIKNSLFDERALKRIGGFDPSSLLPLALGVKYCNENHLSWEEYAMTEEGRKALEVHTPSCDGKRKDALYEIGKWRRGRRGRALRDRAGAAPSFVVG
ncbi:hypothetical protein ACHAXN_009470 [Cyclotella atomus]